MATSPLYNWPEPDNTDLVKNGALAIRTLGNAIDTTMGTMVAKTVVDAKGDLIAASANDTPARLAVGANGTVLTADSAEATGLKWATVSVTPTFVGVNATRTNTSTTVVANTAYQVPFPAEEFDTNAFHDNSINNSRLTIPTGYAGKYIISGWMSNPAGSPGSYQLMRLYKNGSQYTTGGVREGEYTRINTGANAPFGFSQTITASVGDYFEIYYQQNNGETVNMWFNFQLTYVGA